MSAIANPIRQCPACANKNFEVYFEGPLRSGSWGNWTQEKHRALQCKSCQLVYLESGMVDPKIYESAEYRKAFNQASNIEAVKAAHRADDLFHRDHIGSQNFHGKIVADVGAGAGGFLESVLSGPPSGPRESIAVEPNLDFHPSLKSKFEVYSYTSNLIAAGKKPEIITTFNVIEHLSEPKAFLIEIHKALAESGELYLVTPNLDDVLGKMIRSEFLRYFFRTAHPLYFSKASLETLLKSVGFRDVQTRFIHKYGADNLVRWLIDRGPGGKGALNPDLKGLDPVYKKAIEDQGLSSHLLVHCKR